MDEAQRVGEVVEASTTDFVAQCYELYQLPPLGSLVKTRDLPVELYGVVYNATTTSLEPGRRPIARGKDEASEEEIYRSSPQLLKLLKRRRLVVVADGALQYIPVGVLPMPGSTKKTLLNSQFEVVNLPSASTLAALPDEKHERPAPEKLLAVFADPVFSANDSRVKFANAQKQLPVVAGKF